MLVIFSSCESDELLNIDSEYKELLVIQSEIKPDSYFPGVRLTKTLPLGVPYDINLSEIKNATLYIRIDSIKIVPLHYTYEGLYKPLYDFIVNPGEYYELFGERDNQTFYSRTKIPFYPSIKTVSFNSLEFYAEAEVYSSKDECYAALWAVNEGVFRTPDDFFNVSIPENVGVGSTAIVRTASYPDEYQVSAYNGKRYIKIYSFDQTYAKYFLTKSGNETINNPYIQNPGSTDWNVEGTDVIGMFIGSAESNIYFVN